MDVDGERDRLRGITIDASNRPVVTGESMSPLGGLNTWLLRIDPEFGGAIFGQVFNDLNDDGINNDGAAIPNVTVDLFDAAGTTLLSSTTADNLGRYSFANLHITTGVLSTFVVKHGSTSQPVTLTESGIRTGVDFGVFIANVTTTYSNGSRQNIKNLITITSTIEISDSFNIFDIDVQIDITHKQLSDLDVFLIAPDSTRVELTTDNGGHGINAETISFSDTIFDDEAQQSILDGSSPFAGNFRPEGNLSDFDWKNVNGAWMLEITDDETAHTGRFLGWSMIVTGPTAPPPGPNDPPTANDDAATTDEDTAVVIDVLTNDTDPDGDPLTVTSFDATSVEGASISVAPDGSVTYDPTGSATIQNLNGGESLIDTFSYTIGDDNGGSSSATVTVTVNGLDEAAGPTITLISPDSAELNESLIVMVTGTGFVDGATADFGNKVNVQNVTFISDIRLDVQVKVHRRASLGSRDVTITNPDGSSDTRLDVFTVVAIGSSSTSAQSSGPVQSSTLSGSDETSTETSIIEPSDPTLLIVDPVLIEEEPDDESATDDDPVIIPEDQADLDDVFGDLDGSLQEELLTV